MPYFPEKKPEPSGEETKQKKLTEKQSQLLRFCVAILSLLLILYGAVSLIRYIGDLSASRMTSRELREIYNQPTEPPAPEATEETTESSSPETAEDNAAAPSTVQLTASPVPTETPSPLSSADTLHPYHFFIMPGVGEYKALAQDATDEDAVRRHHLETIREKSADGMVGCVISC